MEYLVLIIAFSALGSVVLFPFLGMNNWYFEGNVRDQLAENPKVESVTGFERNYFGYSVAEVVEADGKIVKYSIDANLAFLLAPRVRIAY